MEDNSNEAITESVNLISSHHDKKNKFKQDVSWWFVLTEARNIKQFSTLANIDVIKKCCHQKQTFYSGPPFYTNINMTRFTLLYKHLTYKLGF